MAHMDELSMIVKRVEPDGSLRLSQLGTMYPGNFGLGPLTVLGDEESLTAVLLLGSEHTTPETTRVWQTKPDGGDQAMQWSHVAAFTGRTPEDLAAAGVPPEPASACTAAGGPSWSSGTSSAPTSSTTGPP
jgi:hypothetical protein